MPVTSAQQLRRSNSELRLACPLELSPDLDALSWAEKQGSKVLLTTDPRAAVEGADCVVTDTWVSMNDSKSEAHHNLLRAYQVDDELMAGANPDAIFMHCLPAERGREVTDNVIDSKNSIVFEQAENRLHTQNAIMVTLCDKV